VLGGIAAQLARTVPGYQALLGGGSWRDIGGRRDTPGDDDSAALAATVVLDSGNPSVAYDRALRRPLELLASRGGRRDVVVAVDGLDEASPGFAGLAELFAGHLATPIPGLRLLLTVRSGDVARRLSAPSTLDLVADCPAGVDDVAEYLDVVSGLPPPVRAAVARAAEGSYVYADVVARLAATGTSDGFADGFPVGLDALYGLALDEIGEPDSLARLVLSVLSRSRDRGLTADQLAGVLDTEAARIAEVLHRSRHLLTGDQRVRPHHRCLSEYLAATTPDPGAMDWMIARYLYHRGSGRWRTMREQYALRNLLPHLADAAAVEPRTDGRSVAASEAVRDVAADPEYVTTALLAVGVDDVLSALSYVYRGARCPARNVTLAGILRRQAAALRTARERQDPVLAAQQLLFEAATVGMPDLARRFGEGFPESGIFTLWATSDSPLRLLPDAMRGHCAAVTSVVVASDGTRGVTTARDCETRVWRLASGRLAHTMPTPVPVLNLYAEPDTPWVVASTTQGAQIWDADEGTPVARYTGGQTVLVTAFAVNVDGTLGASGDTDGNVTIWDMDFGKPMLRLPCPGGLVNAIALSPDGQVATTASQCGGVTVWDVKTATPTHRLPGMTAVTSLALSPDNRCLVVGGDGLAGYALDRGEPPRLLARLVTGCPVTAVALNLSMPTYVLFGGASGQVGYVRLPSGCSAGR
jgi:hypothetical protein